MTWLQINDINIDLASLGVILGAILTAVVAPITAYNTWFKQKGEVKRDATKLTLDGVFQLVDQLQDEVKNKALQLSELDTRYKIRMDSFESRIVTYEGTIARQVEIIAVQAEEIRTLRLNQK